MARNIYLKSSWRLGEFYLATKLWRDAGIKCFQGINNRKKKILLKNEAI